MLKEGKGGLAMIKFCLRNKITIPSCLSAKNSTIACNCTTYCHSSVTHVTSTVPSHHCHQSPQQNKHSPPRVLITSHPPWQPPGPSSQALLRLPKEKKTRVMAPNCPHYLPNISFPWAPPRAPVALEAVTVYPAPGVPDGGPGGGSQVTWRRSIYPLSFYTIQQHTTLLRNKYVMLLFLKIPTSF